MSTRKSQPTPSHAIDTEPRGSGDVSLLSFLDLSQLNCLNESSEHTFKSIVSTKFRNTSTNYLLSDADEQLILNIPFNQAVRVRSVVIRSSVKEQAPRMLKLLANRPNLGFGDVEDAEEPEVAQAISISEQDTSDGTPIVLRFVRFQAVNSLHIFVGSNQGDVRNTRIDSIDILGVPVETTKDLGELRNRSE